MVLNLASYGMGDISYIYGKWVTDSKFVFTAEAVIGPYSGRFGLGLRLR